MAYDERATAKCLEAAEFGMEQISRKPGNLLPGREKFLNQLYGIVAEAFIDQVSLVSFLCVKNVYGLLGDAKQILLVLQSTEPLVTVGALPIKGCLNYLVICNVLNYLR